MACPNTVLVSGITRQPCPSISWRTDPEEEETKVKALCYCILCFMFFRLRYPVKQIFWGGHLLEVLSGCQAILLHREQYWCTPDGLHASRECFLVLILHLTSKFFRYNIIIGRLHDFTHIYKVPLECCVHFHIIGEVTRKDLKNNNSQLEGGGGKSKEVYTSAWWLSWVGSSVGRVGKSARMMLRTSFSKASLRTVLHPVSCKYWYTIW